MSNTIKSLFLVLSVLFSFGCSVDLGSDEPCPEPKPPVCAPVQKCMAREAGYVWAGLSTSKVGECTFYRYSCVPNGEAGSEECEQRWETVCPTPDYDINAGERGE